MDVCTLLSCADLGHVSPGMGPRPILKNNYHVNKKKNHFFERRVRLMSGHPDLSGSAHDFTNYNQTKDKYKA